MKITGNQSASPAPALRQPVAPTSPDTPEPAAQTTHHLVHHYEVPDKPVVVIESSKAWVPVNLANLWSYRELLYFLVWRDIKVRYKQTMLGALWAILQPLVTMMIFTYFFGKLARIPTEGVPYPIFFYTGLLLWTYFSGAVVMGANSLLGNTNLITKVYFPRLIIPGAAVGAGLIDFAIASVLLIGLLLYYRFPVTWGYLMLLPLIVLTTLLALALAIWLAALNVRFRDVRYALPFLIQAWMFLSPIIYPSTLMPAQWRWVMILNPLTGIIEGFRAALLGKEFHWLALGYSTFVTALLLVYASYSFRRMEKHFAEII
ncbi:MAG: ABC transporter permease [Acidobacteria bacterium]|nr:ABC transporter permease [Acidobacteriota bacterium]